MAKYVCVGGGAMVVSGFQSDNYKITSYNATYFLILAHVLCKVHEVTQTRTIGSLIDVDLLQLSRRFLQFRTTLLFSALSEDLPRLQYHYRRPGMNM